MKTLRHHRSAGYLPVAPVGTSDGQTDLLRNQTERRTPLPDRDTNDRLTSNLPAHSTAPGLQQKISSLLPRLVLRDLRKDDNVTHDHSNNQQAGSNFLSALNTPAADEIPGSYPNETVQDIHHTRTEEPVRSKTSNPSMFSGSSRNSGARHALLKPAISTDAVDTGLPLAPVLSPPPDALHLDSVLRPHMKTGVKNHSNKTITTMFPNHNVVEANQDVRSRIHAAEDSSVNALTSTNFTYDQPSCIAPRNQHRQNFAQHDITVGALDPDAVAGGQAVAKPRGKSHNTESQASIAHKLGSVDVPSNRLADTAVRPTDDLSRDEMASPSVLSAAAYSRLVPAIRDAVQEAVLVAVRSAVHEVAVMSGNNFNKDEKVHDEVATDSLMRALMLDPEAFSKNSQNPPPDQKRLEASLTKTVNSPLKDRHEAIPSPASQLENTKQAKDSVQSPCTTNAASTVASTAAANGDISSDPKPNHTAVLTKTKRGSSLEPARIPERRSSRRLSKLRGEMSRSSDRRDRSNQTETSAQKVQEVADISSRRHEDAQGVASPESSSRLNPTIWLGDFLHPRTEPYVAKLTEMPVRTRGPTHPSLVGIPITLPRKVQSGELITECSGEAFNSKPARARTNSGFALAEKHNVEPEVFAKTITDLEGLLGEALYIAQQATDKENGRARSRSAFRHQKSPDCSFDEVHESGRSLTGSSASESGDEIDFSSHKTLYQGLHGPSAEISQVKAPRYNDGHASGWPPTGRAVTPIPPRSKPISLKSIPAPEEESHHDFELMEPDDQQDFKSRNSKPSTIADGERGGCSTFQSLHSPQVELNPSLPRSIPKSELGLSRSLDGSHPSEAVDFDHGNDYVVQQSSDPQQKAQNLAIIHEPIELQDIPAQNLPIMTTSANRLTPNSQQDLSLSGKRHVSLKGHKAFSLARSHKRQPIARDWSPGRKRYSAATACISTALIGLLVGIYAGEVPAIQYYIVDFHHYTILGNVFFYIGLSIPTLIFWPLPLLHGRKPYVLGAMSLAMPLLFPQAISVGEFRSPYIKYWRIALLMPRGLMGLTLGFANMNFKNTLLDLFGASLQSANPHQEVVDDFDVRRHGGGMGVWLGLWTWCSIGTIGLGFLVGASVIWHLEPAWGFYISIAIIAFVLFLNVVSPEVRRSSFRRSVAEIRKDGEVSRRLARGEVCLHMIETGPRWWGEEFHQGVMLSIKMLRQPGFLVLALYVAWIYGQIVLVVVLLGSLTSKDYKFLPPFVGLSTTSLPIGALLSIPFQKAGLFSREREHAPESNSATFTSQVTWTSHLVRRTIFVIVLPFAGLGYTLSSRGPPMPFIIPILFAGLIGFLSNLAIAECNGIIMETFDTSDLQPGMTGRPRGKSGERTAWKRTNYSSFPRVASAFAICQGFGFLLGALATGAGGVIQRKLGQQAATGVMAGILLILSILLLGVLVRFKEVQIIPDSKKEHMERWTMARRTSSLRPKSQQDEDEPWRPVIIGNPTNTTRRMNILELGGMSRFSEIRKKNRLVDELSLEAKHPNLAALESIEHKLSQTGHEISLQLRRGLSREGSRRAHRSQQSSPEESRDFGDLGGLREMGQGSRRRKKGKEPAQELIPS